MADAEVTLLDRVSVKAKALASATELQCFKTTTLTDVVGLQVHSLLGAFFARDEHTHNFGGRVPAINASEPLSTGQTLIIVPLNAAVI